MIIKDNLDKIKNKIANCAEKAGRKADEIQLIAVSKLHSSESIMEAYEAGQRIFGENRIQELGKKFKVLPDDIKWNMIGHLQSNKASKAVKCSSLIHSVDSEKILRKINNNAFKKGKTQRILLELNISGEESKYGISENEALLLAEKSTEFKNINLIGLMTMAPFGAEEKKAREIFATLRSVQNNIEEKFQIKIPELSMGMSSDFEAAIMEGSTMVRIGTAIFGNRNYD